MPWELVEFPLFLGTVPPPMDLPESYDSEGMPLDEDIQREWDERTCYVESVKEHELAMGSDHILLQP